MDSTTRTALFFLGMMLILFGFQWYNMPSEEEMARIQAQADSIYNAEQQKIQQQIAQQRAEAELNTLAEADSATMARLTDNFGPFAASAVGTNDTYTIENNLVRLTLASRGGFIAAATLKDYNTYKGEPVSLNQGELSDFNIRLATATKRDIDTKNMLFRPTAKTDSSITLSLLATDGSALDFIYALQPDDYMLSFKIVSHGAENHLKETDNLQILWSQEIFQREKGRKFENRYCTIYYKEYEDDVDYLSETSADSYTASDPIKWVAFKDQFFSTILIADDKFTSASLFTETPREDSDSAFMKRCTANLAVPFATTDGATASFHIYTGPNKYSILYDYDEKLGADVDLNRILTLGWGVFRWVNQGLVIPLFNFLGKYFDNYGLIILLMTIAIKLLIFPMAYKSYLSTAKMRVLRPQIDAINERIPEDKPMERQQEMMKLYSSAGVNPAGGCLPMLLSMPFLIAMFSFFPAAIELRGKSFLWADDLSSYDAIVEWTTQIPILSSTFGNHISLFCLLMTATNLIYTSINMRMTDTGMNNQMPMMKYMMYFMPVFFLFIFNDYASGLSYYYFISLLITIVQTFVIRKTIDEDKLLKKIQERQSKPQSKTSWASRIEDMQRMAEQQQANRRK